MTEQKKSPVAIWVQAARVPFLTATVIPIVLGALVAWHDGSHFNWFYFALTMIGGIFMHTATNMCNDYFDHRSGCDEANPNPTPFSGGSRVIQQGLVKPKAILYASLGCFAAGSLIGLYLNYVCGGNTILILGVIGVFLGFFYTAKPFPIGYCSLGELAVGTGFGPLMVMGAYYVQAHVLPLKVFWISIPVGLLIALVVYINEFPDYEGDKQVNKRTLVVILGKKQANLLYHLLVFSVYLVCVFLVVFKFAPLFCLLVFLSLPLAFKAYAVSKKNFDKIQELYPANASTIGLHSLIGILLCAGFVLDKLIK